MHAFSRAILFLVAAAAFLVARAAGAEVCSTYTFGSSLDFVSGSQVSNPLSLDLGISTIDTSFYGTGSGSNVPLTYTQSSGLAPNTCPTTPWCASDTDAGYLYDTHQDSGTDSYYISFSMAVDTVSVDMYDPVEASVWQLRVYSDAAGTVQIGTYTWTKSTEPDGSAITFPYSSGSRNIRAIRLIPTTGTDWGTGIDNLKVCVVGTPEVEITPTTLNFGSQPINGGPTALQTVTVSNIGTLDLFISNIALSGADAGEFELINTAVLADQYVAAGGSKLIDVWFDPTVVGTVSDASLVLTTSDADEGSLSVTLNGIGTDPAHPDLCDVTDNAEPTPDRAWYTEDSTGHPCAGPYDTTNWCYYDVLDLSTTFPATLRTTNGGYSAPHVSRMEADTVYLSFDLPLKYYDHTLVFPDQASDALCKNVWTLDDSQVTSLDKANCFVTYTYKAAWTSVYNKDTTLCGWKPDLTETGYVKLSLDFAVHSWEDLSTFRTGDQRREITHSMPALLKFPTSVQVDPSPTIQVFSPVRVLATMLDQAVAINPTNGEVTLAVRLLTSVQGPFKLQGMTLIGVDAGDAYTDPPTDATPVGTYDGSDDANNLDTTQTPECTDGGDCEAQWLLTWKHTGVDCDFDGTYTVTFEVTCSADQANCPIDDSTSLAAISFTIDTNDHCPQLVDEIELQSDLFSYEEATHVTPKSAFIHGQTIYFQAPTYSLDLSLVSTSIIRVDIQRASVADIQLFDSATNLANVAPATPWLFHMTAGGAASVGGAPTKSLPEFDFTINTEIGGGGFEMGKDTDETMTVVARVEAVYTGTASTGGYMVRKVTTQASSKSQDLNAEASVAVSGAAGSSSSGSSSTMLGMSATVVYGAAAGVAVVAVLLAVVVMRRRRGGRGSSGPSTTNVIKSSSQANLVENESTAADEGDAVDAVELAAV